MADIPGLIEGISRERGSASSSQTSATHPPAAARGRIAPSIPARIGKVKAIAEELAHFSEALADKARWLVINKIDLLSAADLEVARDMLQLDRAGVCGECGDRGKARGRRADRQSCSTWKVIDADGKAADEFDPRSEAETLTKKSRARIARPIKCRGFSGAERLQALVQAALVTSCLVLCNNTFVGHAVNDGTAAL